MTALGKLFRTTVFKLSLAFLILFSVGAGLVLTSVGARVKEVLDEQIRQTVDAEIRALSEQYSQGGIRQLTDAVERRVRQGELIAETLDESWRQEVLERFGHDD